MLPPQLAHAHLTFSHSKCAIKNRNQKKKKSVKYMLICLGLYPSRLTSKRIWHCFLSSMKISRGIFSSNVVKQPVNVDHMIFSLSLSLIFWICAEANIVPLNLKRKYFKSYAICSLWRNSVSLSTLKSFDQSAIAYFLWIFSGINVSILVWVCDAVGG